MSTCCQLTISLDFPEICAIETNATKAERHSLRFTGHWSNGINQIFGNWIIVDLIKVGLTYKYSRICWLIEQW